VAPSVSKSLLTQELLGCAWVVSVKQLEQHIEQLAQLVRGQISDFRLKMTETDGTVIEKNEDRWQYVNERVCAQKYGVGV